MNIRIEQRYRCGGRKEAVEQLVRIDKGAYSSLVGQKGISLDESMSR